MGDYEIHTDIENSSEYPTFRPLHNTRSSFKVKLLQTLIRAFLGSLYAELNKNSNKKASFSLHFLDYKRNHIPAFGNWDYEDGLPITQYFESARQAGLLRYQEGEEQEEDLYSAYSYSGFEYFKPPVVVGPKMKTKRRDEKSYQPHVKEQKRQVKVYDVAQTARGLAQPPPPPSAKAPKAVDEDLYKIPPELLYSYPKKKKKMFGFFSCLVPSCAASV